MADTSTEESYDEDALFAKYLEHGKTFGYQDKKLEDYVAKQINAARDRHDRVLDRQSKKEIEIKRIEQESNSKKEIELEKVKQATKLLLLLGVRAYTASPDLAINSVANTFTCRTGCLCRSK